MSYTGLEYKFTGMVQYSDGENDVIESFQFKNFETYDTGKFIKMVRKVCNVPEDNASFRILNHTATPITKDSEEYEDLMNVPKEVISVSENKSVKTETGNTTAKSIEIPTPRTEVSKPRAEGFAGADNIQPESVSMEGIIDESPPQTPVVEKPTTETVTKPKEAVKTATPEKPTVRKPKRDIPAKSTNKSRATNKKRPARPTKATKPAKKARSRKGLLNRVLGNK